VSSDGQVVGMITAGGDTNDVGLRDGVSSRSISTALERSTRSAVAAVRR
jgi:hypothetical protein